jgi:hypothetical protein
LFPSKRDYWPGEVADRAQLLSQWNGLSQGKHFVCWYLIHQNLIHSSKAFLEVPYKFMRVMSRTTDCKAFAFD